MKTINFKRRLAEVVKQKISQSLKGRKRRAGAGKTIGTKVNKIPNDTMGEMQMINTAGVQDDLRRSRTKGAIADGQARQGFTGYTPSYKSKQNRYNQNLKKFLRE